MTTWNRILFGAGVALAAAAGCGDEADDDGGSGTATGGTASGGFTASGSATATGGFTATGSTTASGGVRTTGGMGGTAELGGAAGEGMGGAPSPNAGTGRLISGVCYPRCENPSSDDDGNGWGWENDGSCIVESSALYQSGEPCGDPPPSVECGDGCAILSAPLTGQGQTALWQIALDDVDASTETLTVRIYIEAGTRGAFRYGFESDGISPGVIERHNLNEDRGTWLNLTIDMSDYAPAGPGGAPNPPTTDSSHVTLLTFGIESGTGGGQRTNPSIVWIDSVRSSAGTIDYEFASNVSVLSAGAGSLGGSTATHTTFDP